MGVNINTSGLQFPSLTFDSSLFGSSCTSIGATHWWSGTSSKGSVFMILVFNGP